jgi:Cupredoxin-like domain
MLFIDSFYWRNMGSGVGAGLVLAGGLLFTGAIAIATQYNLMAIALGSFGSILFALREGFTPSGSGMERADRTPTKWLWFVMGVALMLLTLTPIFGAFSAAPAVATGTSSGGSSSPPPSGAATTCGNPCVIVIKNSQFGSANQLKDGNGYVVVKAGTNVIWENRDDTQHTTTSNSGLWDSGILNPGQNFNFTFSHAGTFSYICNVHPMTGTVVVVT